MVGGSYGGLLAIKCARSRQVTDVDLIDGSSGVYFLWKQQSTLVTVQLQILHTLTNRTE